MKSPHYVVVCGNVGGVYDGYSLDDATRAYRLYVDLSKGETGKAGGEDVTLFEDDEPLLEHIGSLTLAEEQDPND